MDFQPLTLAPAPLRAFVEKHRAELERLGCGHFTHYAKQPIRPGFTKYVLGQRPDGAWAMLHHITSPDTGAPHDHPCVFEAHVFGGYTERIYFYTVSGWQWNDVCRPDGGTHWIAPDCIHRLLELHGPESWTLALAGPAVQQPREYPEALKTA